MFFGPSYSTYDDPYSAGYYAPNYVDYSDPYGPSYSDSYSSYYDPYSGYSSGYSDPYASNYTQGYGYGTDYCSLAGNGYWNQGSLADTLSRLLASGYDQGYSDGLYASSYGHGHDSYYNPYAYDDQTSYAAYSYRLAENRQCLSEGYELGYRDALAGRSDYNPLYNGNADLVSMLLGNALQYGG